MRQALLSCGILLASLAAQSLAAQAQPFAVTEDDWHWYEVLDVPGGATWDQANAAATFAGGYLATITSREENDFVFSLLDDNSYWFQDAATGVWKGPWIGGFQFVSGGGPATGWGWNNLEPFSYANWTAGFPTDSSATNRVQFGGDTAGRTGTWADASMDEKRKGFVVEYSGPTAKRTLGLITDEPGSSGAYTLWTHTTETWLIDPRGRVVHQWSSPYLPGGAHYLLESGNLVRSGRIDSQVFLAGGRGGILQEFDWDGNLVWEYQLLGPTLHHHHDFERLPSGNYLILAWELKTAAEAIAAGRDPGLLSGGELWPDMLVEVQPTGVNSGTIVWEWHTWDHLIQDRDPTVANFGAVEDHPELVDVNYAILPGRPDWMHSNAVDYNPALDQIMISVRDFDEIWIIDHSTTTQQAASHSGGRSGKGGDLLYRWGNPLAYRAGNPQDRRLYRQHDAHWIEAPLAGAGNILVFNNGVNRPGGSYSSADEIVPPAVDQDGNYPRSSPAWGPPSANWSYFPTSRLEFFSRATSGAQRMPNGNTVLQGGWIGTLFELDPQGRRIWEYEIPIAGVARPQGSVQDLNRYFRAPQYTADHPALVGRSLQPGEPLEIHPSVLLVEGSTTPYRAFPGEAVSFSLRAEDQPGKTYVVGCSVTEGVIPLGLRYVRLGLDPLLAASVGGTDPGTFQNFLGTLDSQGHATATLAIPPLNSLIGLELDTAFVVLDLAEPAGIAFISNTVGVSIE